jgi:uncharacterized protein
MSTRIAVREVATSGAVGHHQGRSSDRAYVIFTSATVVGLIHAVDDAIVHRQPGVPITQHLWALGAVLVIAGPALWFYRGMRTGVRAAVAFAFGALILANGAMHAIHVAVDDISSSDVTGIIAAGAGAVLAGLSVTLAFGHRGERASPPVRRWMVRVLVSTTGVALVLVVLLPLMVGIGQTHFFRRAIGPPPDSSYQAVTFRSSDGLLLAGWYRPSRNGSAVVVVSGARGDRLGSVEHARLLEQHGYGVLLYDARGTGESQGSPNGYGWGRDHDVAGALTFLTTRPEVDPDRIGGLGLSRGADVLIEVAATDPRLKAVVADGATARSLADVPPGDWAAALWLTPVLTMVSLLSGDTPGPSLVELVAEVSPTPLLLIATGSLADEIRLNEIYARAARPPVDLWVLPEARHTAAIRDEAVAYERRVIGHFDEALLAGGSRR